MRGRNNHFVCTYLRKPQKKNAKNILLIDVDDTILDFSLGENIAIKQALPAFGLPAEESIALLYHEINKQVWVEYEAGLINQSEIGSLRFRRLVEQLGKPEINAVSLNAAYCDRLAMQHAYRAGAKRFILFIRRFYRVILISNGTSNIQKQRLTDSGLIKLVERNFVSGDMGVRKPDYEYFHRVAEETPDFCAENAVVVGDSLTSDIAGAVNFGLTSVWFNTKDKQDKQGLADFEVHDYKQLRSLLLLLHKKHQVINNYHD